VAHRTVIVTGVPRIGSSLCMCLLKDSGIPVYGVRSMMSEETRGRIATRIGRDPNCGGEYEAYGIVGRPLNRTVLRLVKGHAVKIFHPSVLQSSCALSENDILVACIRRPIDTIRSCVSMMGASPDIITSRVARYYSSLADAVHRGAVNIFDYDMAVQSEDYVKRFCERVAGRYGGGVRIHPAADSKSIGMSDKARDLLKKTDESYNKVKSGVDILR